jgi:anti-sigma regulatory factor (Ser/Thr protein kinase)
MDSPDRDLHVTVRSDPKLLASVRSLVRSWVESWDVGKKTTDDVVLAIDEACTNAIRHAYEGRCDGSVELTLHAEPEYLEFQVRSADIDDLQPGGLGIQLIHEVFDEVDFCPGESGGNCVTMKLRRSK